LIEIAIGGGVATSLKVVAERQLLSHAYLEQLLSQLRRAGIVESIRGAQGGYRLALPPEEVDALRVVEILEGGLAPVACIDDDDSCDRTGACATEALWRRVHDAVRRELAGTTLADLIGERRLLQIEPLPDHLAPH
jgi:Rrf2 family protein